MKPDRDLRITIIGMGNLMESLFPTVRDVVGPDGVPHQVNATTADERWREKGALLGISVRFRDNLQALMDMQPDIVLFAPPPTLAKPIVENDLKPYFDACRRERRPLPALYAFPPVPHPDYYYQVLGEDILVATIIPDTVREIGGEPVRGEGIHLCTLSKPWPTEPWAQLQRLFSPLGQVVELAPREGIPVLTGLVVLVLLCWKGATFIAEELAQAVPATSHREIASYLRARARTWTGYQPPAGSTPCATNAVRNVRLASALDGVLRTWIDGITDYWSQAGIPKKKAQQVLARDIDFRLHIAQCESVEAIHHLVVIGATKGGVLERGMEIFQATLGPLLRRALVDRGRASTDGEWNELKQAVIEACRQVEERGRALND